MKILIVLQSEIPAIQYGGTQRVVWYLAKELNAMGHNVTLLVARGSHCPFAKIIEIDPSRPIHQQIPNDIDVVHFNSLADPQTTKPYVVTIHGNNEHPNSSDNSIYVSKNHAERYGSKNFVHNGLDWSDYGDVDLNKKREHYHFLGKAAWRVKNVRGAIRIVRSIQGARMKVLGGERLNFKMGFRLTLSPRIEFCGMVDDLRKREVITRSKGLIFPVLWDEPFGLAITESLYFGSPVFGTLRGSLPELVTEDVGFLSNDEDEIVQSMRDAQFSPRRCHEYAMDCFNSRLMAENYIKMYERVINNGNKL